MIQEASFPTMTSSHRQRVRTTRQRNGRIYFSPSSASRNLLLGLILVLSTNVLTNRVAVDASHDANLHREFNRPTRIWDLSSAKGSGTVALPWGVDLRGGAVAKNGPNHKKNKVVSATNGSQKKKTSGDSRPQNDPQVLLLIRIMFFTYYASLGSLLPYLPVYYHSLGHGGQIIGMLGAIKPFTTFLVAPLWGIISDQTGSPFAVLYFTFLVSLVGQLLVAWRHDPAWIMAMVFITAVFNAPVKSLLDSMVMSNLNDRSQYGRLRLWGQLGFGVGSSSVGLLLSKSQHRPYTPPLEGTPWMEHLDEVWQSMTGYKLLFLSYAMLSVPTLICVRAFDRWTKETTQQQHKEEHEASNRSKRDKTGRSAGKPRALFKRREATEKLSVWDGMRVLVHNSDALLFFSLVLVVGVSSGVIENFAYVRIREVGGTGKDMGLSRLVSSMAGAPMFWFSGPLTELLGADRVIVLSLLTYVVRYFNYALMQSPWQGLPAEALRGVTFAAFWSTCTIYASRIAPPGMQATMVRSYCRRRFRSRSVWRRCAYSRLFSHLFCHFCSHSADVSERNVWRTGPIPRGYHRGQTTAPVWNRPHLPLRRNLRHVLCWAGDCLPENSKR